MELPIAPNPVDWDRYDAFLLLNNDPGYREILVEAARSSSRTSITLYDPWRVVVSPDESVFQSFFPMERFLQ